MANFVVLAYRKRFTLSKTDFWVREWRNNFLNPRFCSTPFSLAMWDFISSLECAYKLSCRPRCQCRFRRCRHYEERGTSFGSSFLRSSSLHLSFLHIFDPLITPAALAP